MTRRRIVLATAFTVMASCLLAAWAMSAAPAPEPPPLTGRWVREVVDPEPMPGAGGLSVAAVEFNGRPAVVYRKRLQGDESPRLVIAVRGAGGWDIQTVVLPEPGRNPICTDAVAVGGTAYVAVASGPATKSEPDSLRVLEHTPAGWRTVFQRANVGPCYGYAVRLGQ